jgi:hypothetical protein
MRKGTIIIYECGVMPLSRGTIAMKAMLKAIAMHMSASYVSYEGTETAGKTTDYPNVKRTTPLEINATRVDDILRRHPPSTI